MTKLRSLSCSPFLYLELDVSTGLSSEMDGRVSLFDILAVGASFLLHGYYHLQLSTSESEAIIIHRVQPRSVTFVIFGELR